MNHYKKLLKNKNFVYLWTSQLLSQVTINMMNFLLLTRLFRITESSIATSLLWVTFALPAIFFGPIGAASVDIVSKRKMLMVTNLLQALSVFVFFFFHQQSFFLLYMVVLAYSFFNQFYVPAESASVPKVVPVKNLPIANGLFLITQQAALVVGFGLGGIIERIIGFNGSLILCSIFLFIAFISVSFLPEISVQKKISNDFEKMIKDFFASISEGYEFIKEHKEVLYPVVILLVLQICLTILAINLPVIGNEVLRISLNYSGVLIVVPAGIGAFLGSVYVPKKLSQNIRKKSIIEKGLLLFGFSIVSMSLVSYVPELFRIIATIFVLVITGFGYILATIPTITYLQEVTPEKIRGRVFGNFSFLVTILTLFPVIFSGFFTEIFGIKFMLLIIALGTLLIYYYFVNKGQKLIEDNLNGI